MNSFLLIEKDFDSRSLRASAYPEVSDAMRGLLGFLERSDWRGLLDQGPQMFSMAENGLERAFILQWLVGTAESQGEHHLRGKLLLEWKNIPSWAAHWYMRYLKSYMESLTFYFDGSLHEAEARLRSSYEMASDAGYPRGQMRCLFHIGLICKERKQANQAIEYFNRAFEISLGSGALNWQERIAAQLRDLGAECLERSSSVVFDSAPLVIERFLSARDFDKARRLLIESEISRRSSGMGRKAKSLYQYLPILLAARGRRAAARRILAVMRDPILKARTLELKERALGLSDEEKGELEHLRACHGLKGAIFRSSLRLEDTVIAGKRLSRISNPDIRKLIEVLLESDIPVSKETLCARIWNLSYDPTVHDGRLYRLICRARKLFGDPDLFINTYGEYRLNHDAKKRA